jgi:hypothetical protein
VLARTDAHDPRLVHVARYAFAESAILASAARAAVSPRARSANAGATSAVRRIRSGCGFLFSYSSRSEGTMMATPLALDTPTLIGAPPAVSSPNAL